MQPATAPASMTSFQIPDGSQNPNDSLQSMSMTSAEEQKGQKNAKMKKIITPIAVFLGCILLGYFGLMMIFNVGNLMKPKHVRIDSANSTQIALNKVMYVMNDLVGIYAEESLDSTPLTYLSRGDVVTLVKTRRILF